MNASLSRACGWALLCLMVLLLVTSAALAQQVIDLPVGQSAVGTLGSPEDVHYYRLTAPDGTPVGPGQHLLVTLDKATPWYGRVSIRADALPGPGSGDTIVSSCALTDCVAEVVVTAEADYFVRVDGNGAGVGQYALRADASPTLELGVPHQDVLTNGYDRRWYRLSLSGGQRAFVIIDKAGGWYGQALFRCGGLPDGSGETSSTPCSYSDEALEIATTETGDYFIEIDSLDANGGAYTLTAVPPDAVPTLTPDGAVSGALTDRDDVKWYRLLLAAGEHAVVTLDKASGWYGRLSACEGTLPPPDGAGVVADGPHGEDQAVELVPAGGECYLRVDGAGWGWGAYRLSLSTGPTLVVGVPRIGQVAGGGDHRWYRVAAAAGQHLIVIVDKATDWDGLLSMRPGGLPSPGGGDTQASEVEYSDQAVELIAPEDGECFIRVDGATSGGGTYTVTVLTPELLPQLPIGPVVAGALIGRYDVRWYRIEVPEAPPGQQILVYLDKDLAWYSGLSGRAGGLPGGPDTSYAGHSVDLEQGVSIPAGPAGDCFVRVDGGDFGSGAYEIRAALGWSLPPTVTSVTPAYGGNAGVVTVTISGKWFGPAATAVLHREGQPDIVPFDTTWLSSAEMVVRFDLRGALAGSWQLLLSNPGRTPAPPCEFSIEDGGAAELWVQVVGPDRVRAGTTATYIIEYGNSGSVDAYDLNLVLTLRGPDGTVWQTDVARPAETGPSEVPIGEPAPEGDGIQAPLWVYSLEAGQRYPLEVAASTPPGPTSVPVIVEAQLGQTPVSEFAVTGRVEVLGVSTSLASTSRALETAAMEDMTEDEYEDYLDWLASCGGYPSGCILPEYQDTVLQKYVNPKAQGRKWFGDIASKATLFSKFTWGIYSLYRNLRLLWDTAEFANNYKYGARRQTSVVFAVDPNEKDATVGFGATGMSGTWTGDYPPDSSLDNGYVSAARPVHYVIRFENLPAATAEAENIAITDTVEAGLDWSTLAVGKTQVAGADYEPVVTVNPQTRTIAWSFPGVNLPPNTGDDGKGEGWVSFSVKPLPDLTTGAELHNVACIVFDENPPMWTNDCVNCIDAAAPESAVAPLPEESPHLFPVTWGGFDDEQGTGVRDYTVYVSDNGQPYTVWLQNTTDDIGTFAGTWGHTYAFYSVARDQVGNLEVKPSPAMPEATTTVPGPHHYHFQTLAGPVGADAAHPLPVHVAVEAHDPYHDVVTTYSGAADLSTSVGTVTPAVLDFESGVATAEVVIYATPGPTAPSASLSAGEVGGSLAGTSDSFPLCGKGDPTGDGATNVLDIIRTVSIALDAELPTPPASEFQTWAADVPDESGAVDGVVDVSDVLRVVNLSLGLPAATASRAASGLPGRVRGAPHVQLRQVGAGEWEAWLVGGKGVAGIQLEVSAGAAEVAAGPLLTGAGWSLQTQCRPDAARIIAFSPAATGLTAHRGVVLRLSGVRGRPQLGGMVLVDGKGRKLSIGNALLPRRREADRAARRRRP